MKWVYKALFGLLILVTAAAAAGSLYFFSRVNGTAENEADYQIRNFPDSYFSLILNTQDDVYWQDYKNGAIDAGKKYNAAIEINEVTEPESDRQIIEYLRIAKQAKMDGIVVAGESSEEFNQAILDAAEAKINVVLGNNSSGKNNRVIYVGTNSYEFGDDAADLIAQLRTDESMVDLAVIFSEEYSEDAAINPGVMLNGLKRDYINVVSTLYGTSGLLGAEGRIRATLNDHPDIDALLCTNAKDTISAANVIIERNLVGKVKIIGTGVTDQIVDYIKKGVIGGVIDRNGYEAGFESVRLLYECKGTTLPTLYLDINATTYTKDNISFYTKP